MSGTARSHGSAFSRVRYGSRPIAAPAAAQAAGTAAPAQQPLSFHLRAAPAGPRGARTRIVPMPRSRSSPPRTTGAAHGNVWRRGSGAAVAIAASAAGNGGATHSTAKPVAAAASSAATAASAPPPPPQQQQQQQQQQRSPTVVHGTSQAARIGTSTGKRSEGGTGGASVLPPSRGRATVSAAATAVSATITGATLRPAKILPRPNPAATRMRLQAQPLRARPDSAPASFDDVPLAGNAAADTVVNESVIGATEAPPPLPERVPPPPLTGAGPDMKGPHTGTRKGNTQATAVPINVSAGGRTLAPMTQKGKVAVATQKQHTKRRSPVQRHSPAASVTTTAQVARSASATMALAPSPPPMAAPTLVSVPPPPPPRMPPTHMAGANLMAMPGVHKTFTVIGDVMFEGMPPPPPPPPSVDRFKLHRKTVLCSKYMAGGNCDRPASMCSFAHGKHELHQVTPAEARYKSTLKRYCRAYDVYEAMLSGVSPTFNCNTVGDFEDALFDLWGAFEAWLNANPAGTAASAAAMAEDDSGDGDVEDGMAELQEALRKLDIPRRITLRVPQALHVAHVMPTAASASAGAFAVTPRTIAMAPPTIGTMQPLQMRMRGPHGGHVAARVNGRLGTMTPVTMPAMMPVPRTPPVSRPFLAPSSALARPYTPVTVSTPTALPVPEHVAAAAGFVTNGVGAIKRLAANTTDASSAIPKVSTAGHFTYSEDDASSLLSPTGATSSTLTPGQRERALSVSSTSSVGTLRMPSAASRLRSTSIISDTDGADLTEGGGSLMSPPVLANTKAAFAPSAAKAGTLQFRSASASLAASEEDELGYRVVASAKLLEPPQGSSRLDLLYLLRCGLSATAAMRLLGGTESSTPETAKRAGYGVNAASATSKPLHEAVHDIGYARFTPPLLNPNGLLGPLTVDWSMSDGEVHGAADIILGTATMPTHLATQGHETDPRAVGGPMSESIHGASAMSESLSHARSSPPPSADDFDTMSFLKPDMTPFGATRPLPRASPITIMEDEALDDGFTSCMKPDTKPLGSAGNAQLASTDTVAPAAVREPSPFSELLATGTCALDKKGSASVARTFMSEGAVPAAAAVTESPVEAVLPPGIISSVLDSIDELVSTGGSVATA